MAKFRLIRDSGRNPSWTLTIAIPTLFGINTWFILGGLDVTFGGFHFLSATKSGVEYAAAITPWLAYIAQRSWRRKGETNVRSGDDPGTPPA